jgi:GNAT superfamily N-acetyltransferase
MSTEITARTGDYYGDGTSNLIWEIRDTDGLAAELYVNAEHRMIMNVEVREDRRGEGLARALYEAAQATGTVYHVPAWGRTPEGDAFAAAMGGETMDDETAAEITGTDLGLIGAL